MHLTYISILEIVLRCLQAQWIQSIKKALNAEHLVTLLTCYPVPIENFLAEIQCLNDKRFVGSEGMVDHLLVQMVDHDSI